ncbi:MAG: substrate-binding domain-containing protein [Clostridia bacterium]|nr:substrate-binding domain-containing protein [Clostridia bacterium]
MKRVIALLIAVILVLSLCACAAKPAPEEDLSASADGTEKATASPEPTAEPTPEPTDAPTPEPTAPAPVGRPACSLEEYPKVDGSTANIPMAMNLVRLVTGCTEDEAERTIRFSTTDYSYAALAEGRCDLLLVYEASHPTKEKYDPVNRFDMHPIGLDALVFITNTDNPVDSLTVEQIRGIFSGNITNWKEVGGRDAPIVAFQRPELSGSQTLMLDLCMKEVPMAPVEVITVSESMGDVIDDIAAYDNTSNAIGYSVYYYAKNMYTYPNLKFITVEGVAPTNETINSGEYLFINPFYAILPRTGADEIAVNIVNWLETPEGQAFVEHCGYVPYFRY